MASQKRKSFVFGKIAVFFMLMVSCFAAATAALGCILAMKAGLYGDNVPDHMVMEVGRDEIEDVARTLEMLLAEGMGKGQIEDYFSGTNYDIEIWSRKGIRPIWGTYHDAYTTLMIADVDMLNGYYFSTVQSDGFYLPASEDYICRVYVKPSFPEHDILFQIYQEVRSFYLLRYVWICLAAGAVIVAVLCLFLLKRIDSKQGKDKEEKTILHDKKSIFFSVIGITIILATIILIARYLLNSLESWRIIPGLAVKGGATAIAMIIIIWFISHIRWCRWIAYKIMSGVSCCLSRGSLLMKQCSQGLQKIPLVVAVLTGYLVICLLEFLICFFYMQKEGILFMALEKLGLLFVVIYVAVCCKHFLSVGEALAQGEQEQRVNTSKMIGVMKRHGENLNSIGQGISKAVDARMKSERMKTELITNVSHDLKTPLTSIINYSKLISEQKTENQVITEYSQVLLRQSERLKKLLEDLVEASKATTGNLEVHLMPCEVGVLLTQAVGEYQHRFEEKNLDLRTVQPEEPLQIMADGKHLWRVFDNLLNNICKYAQEGSRVYLNVEQRDKRIVIIFRNMSKYPLNISAEELEERFVRGDKSRHMEGNGLGLPIAKSLVELQNGRMEIVTDGDLFKITVSFERLEETASTDSPQEQLVSAEASILR